MLRSTEELNLLKLYGIRNCDTVKKARKFLDEKEISYSFHDYKKDGSDSDALKAACSAFGWEQVLNKRGTTWRKLDDQTKDSIVDVTSAIALMEQETSAIKRPIVLGGKEPLLGFDAAKWQDLHEKGEL